jgi:hypothetical protein
VIGVGQSIGNFCIQYLENTRVRDIERKNIWGKIVKFIAAARAILREDGKDPS